MEGRRNKKKKEGQKGRRNSGGKKERKKKKKAKEKKEKKKRSSAGFKLVRLVLLVVLSSDLSMSSIFGLRSSYMLEYCWLFALLLRSARYFTGIEGKWTPLPPISPPSCDFHEPLDFHRPIAALAQWSLCGIHYWLSEDYNEVWKNCVEKQEQNSGLAA